MLGKQHPHYGDPQRQFNAQVEVVKTNWRWWDSQRVTWAEGHWQQRGWRNTGRCYCTREQKMKQEELNCDGATMWEPEPKREGLSGKDLELTSEEVQLLSETLPEAYRKRGEIPCFVSPCWLCTFPPASPSGHIYIEASWQRHLEGVIPSAPSRAVGGVRGWYEKSWHSKSFTLWTVETSSVNFQSNAFLTCFLRASESILTTYWPEVY